VEQPEKAGIDPFKQLGDRNSENNLIFVPAAASHGSRPAVSTHCLDTANAPPTMPSEDHSGNPSGPRLLF